MLTADVSGIKKNALPNVTFILNVLSENGIFKIKKQKTKLRAHALCVNMSMREYVMS